MSGAVAGTRPHRVDGAAEQAVHAALADLRRALSDIIGALAASVDGLPIAAAVYDHDPAQIAAMAASAAGLGKWIVDDFRFGDFAENVVRASGGYFIVYSIGQVAVLAVMATAGANLGRVHLEARRCASKIQTALARSAA